MRNFTHEQIEILVNNGFLMPGHFQPQHVYEDYENKKERAFSYLAGSPVIIGKSYFIRENNNFPTHLLKEYTIEVTQSFRPSMQDVFYIPSGLQDMNNFNENNPQLVEKLKEYIDLSQLYLDNELNAKEKIKTQLGLLEIFRQLFCIYVLDCYSSLSVTSDTFLKFYQQGLEYRTNFKTFNSSAFKSFNINEVDILSAVFENTEDLIVFENATLNTKVYFKRFHDIPVHVLPAWKQILIYKSWAGSYPQSPYFEKFKNNIRSYNYNATQTTIDLLELLNMYHFSLLKDTYLTILKNCNKPGLITYIEEQLKKHNCLPQSSETLIIKKDSYVIYNDTYHLSFNFFKSYVKNHVYAAQCLIAIVAKSFKLNELDCSRIHYSFVKDSDTVIFLIETLQPHTIEELSKKFLDYIKCVLLPEFLDDNTIKLLSTHPSNAYSRKLYEDDKNVMGKYLTLKDKFLLKQKMENKLVTKQSNEKVNKI